jgi:hypothetical protein
MGTNHIEISHDRIQMLGAAFSTASLPVALGLRIEKTALRIFLDQSSNWRSVARIIPAELFREGAVVRLGMGSGFEKVGRDVELKTTFISEESATYTIDTYGKAFHIARAALIDDSIGILNHIPMLIGNDSSKRMPDTLLTSPHSHETLGLSVRRCMDRRISLGKWRAVVRFDFAPYS